ncbi:MAG: DUF3097 family protein, partial [Acidimicrobiia bacterium]|nr:DUF3097 family protein [Acidimicrobiia bacterium]
MGILSEPLDLNGPSKERPHYASIPAELGMTIRHRSSFKTGTIIAFDSNWVTMRGEDGREFKQRNEPGAFSHNGTAVTLIRSSKTTTIQAAPRTASGSIAVPNAPARVARPSRIYVEVPPVY